MMGHVQVRATRRGHSKALTGGMTSRPSPPTAVQTPPSLRLHLDSTLDRVQWDCTMAGGGGARVEALPVMPRGLSTCSVRHLSAHVTITSMCLQLFRRLDQSSSHTTHSLSRDKETKALGEVRWVCQGQFHCGIMHVSTQAMTSCKSTQVKTSSEACQNAWVPWEPSACRPGRNFGEIISAPLPTSSGKLSQDFSCLPGMRLPRKLTGNSPFKMNN